MDIFFFQRIEGALEDCISVEIESRADDHAFHHCESKGQGENHR